MVREERAGKGGTRDREDKKVREDKEDREEKEKSGDGDAREALVRGLVRDFNSSVLCDCRQVQYGVAHLICDRKIASVRLEDKPLKETV